MRHRGQNAIRRFNDDGGSITELGRLTGGQHGQLAGFECAQINYSEIEPGAVKAYHLHKRQTDVWYVPPGDKLLLVLADVRAGSDLGVARHGLLDHGVGADEMNALLAKHDLKIVTIKDLVESASPITPLCET